ncbi:MAG: hypothetical protein JRN20_21940, partial [Nitrososphaerota archaeon]|nr:hypothetical protein [Nitrososphaerota archaeon]
NAVIPEIFRAKASQVVGDLVGALGIIKSLPLSYNLDLQELTRNLWSALDKSIESIQVFSEMIEEMKFNDKSLRDATSDDDFLYSTELADYLVLNFKIPFREAHNRVGALVRYCSDELKLTSRQFRSLDEDTLMRFLHVKISKEQINDIVNPYRTLDRRTAVGSPNPRLTKKQCKSRFSMIRNHENTLEMFETKIAESRKLLQNVAEHMDSSLMPGKKNQK